MSQRQSLRENMAIPMDDKCKTTVSSAVAILFEHWKISEAQKIAILDFDSCANLVSFFNSPSTFNWSPALEQRLSLILNIHAKLRLLFSNPNNVYGYMTMVNKNSPFNGRKPIELASQNLEGLNTVYQAISSIDSNG